MAQVARVHPVETAGNELFGGRVFFRPSSWIKRVQMKTLLTLALMLAMFTSACTQDSTVVLDARFSEVRELIIDQVTDGGVPSIAVAVAEDGEII